jgi:hypothetical protein
MLSTISGDLSKSLVNGPLMYVKLPVKTHKRKFSLAPLLPLLLPPFVVILQVYMPDGKITFVLVELSNHTA